MTVPSTRSKNRRRGFFKARLASGVHFRIGAGSLRPALYHQAMADDLERVLRGLEEAEVGKALIVECRLRPLDNPMAMNGCALVVINPPASVHEPLEDANRWIVGHCGGEGGESRVWTL